MTGAHDEANTLTWEPVAPAAWAAKLESLGASAGDTRWLLPLRGDELLATARDATGLDDFGPDGWRVHFDVLVEALDESPLSVIGRLMVRSELVRSLRNRLLLAAHHDAHPELAETPVPAPIFVVGTARSGTSITHELLACDPANRVPTTWMALHPVEAATAPASERAHWRRVGDEEVTLWHDVIPAYAGMHLNGGDLPTECIFLTMNEFLSDQWGGNHEIPTYGEHLIGADHRAAYATHRRILQVLQTVTPGTRWALKAPSHLATLDALFHVYPDARVVMLHRDPLETMPSTLSLMSTLKRMRNTAVDIAPMAATLPYGYEYMLRSVLDRRASGDLPDGQFCDVAYPDLLAEPVTTLRGVYDGFGLEFDDELGRSMHRYLDDKPRGAHGPHHYALADFGLDESVERERFRFYTDRFGLAGRGTGG